MGLWSMSDEFPHYRIFVDVPVISRWWGTKTLATTAVALRLACKSRVLLLSVTRRRAGSNLYKILIEAE